MRPGPSRPSLMDEHGDATIFFLRIFCRRILRGTKPLLGDAARGDVDALSPRKAAQACPQSANRDKAKNAATLLFRSQRSEAQGLPGRAALSPTRLARGVSQVEAAEPDATTPDAATRTHLRRSRQGLSRRRIKKCSHGAAAGADGDRRSCLAITVRVTRVFVEQVVRVDFKQRPLVCGHSVEPSCGVRHASMVQAMATGGRATQPTSEARGGGVGQRGCMMPWRRW